MREVEVIAHTFHHPRVFSRRLVQRTLPFVTVLALPLVSHSHPPLHPETTLILAPLSANIKSWKERRQERAMESFERFLLDMNEQTKQAFLRHARRTYRYNTVTQKWMEEYRDFSIIYAYYSKKQGGGLSGFCNALQETMGEPGKPKPDEETLNEKYGPRFVEEVKKLKNRLAVFGRLLSTADRAVLMKKLEQEFGHWEAKDIYEATGKASTLEGLMEATHKSRPQIFQVLAFMEENGMVKKAGWKEQWETCLREHAEESARRTENLKQGFFLVLKYAAGIALFSLAAAFISTLAIAFKRKINRIRGDKMKKRFEEDVEIYRAKLRAICDKYDKAKTEDEVTQIVKESGELLGEINSKYKDDSLHNALKREITATRIYLNRALSRITGKDTGERL